jgi:hypothetical protein
MEHYTIVADPRVKDDLKEAKEYLNKKRGGSGKKFLKEYKKTLIYLQKNPLFQIRYNNVHCLPLKTFKYMIHFQVREQEKVVHIYAVLSTYLNPDSHYIKNP